jgi:hypothetical protein
MIRTVLLFLYILGFSGYAYRNWFLSLCALIILNPINQHPDMPDSILGIPGLSPWNFLLMNVVMAWLLQRGRERARFDPPPLLAGLSFAYFMVLMVAWLRMFYDRTNIEDLGSLDLITDLLVNSIKWVVPGILLFDGARTPKRVRFAILTICGIYVLFGLQVLKWMPPWMILNGDELQKRAIKLIEKEMGYSRVNMSMMLAGGSWALLCAREIFTTRRVRLLAFALFLAIGFAQAMTGGRMGYVTWIGIGAILSFVRWRRYLILGPALIMVIIAFVPAVRDRALTGVEDNNMAGEEVQVNTAEMTSDRTIIWPAVIEKIKTAPVAGFGLMAMQRTGLSQEYHDLAFPHPHNAYLEILLDAGIIGFIPVVGFFVVVFFYSSRLFMLARNVSERAVGGMTFALVLALIIAAFGSQHFLPQEGGVGMWCAIGMCTRLTVDRAHARMRKRRERQAVHNASLAPASPAAPPRAAAR